MKHSKKTNTSDNNSKNAAIAAWRGWVAASGKDEATQTLEKALHDIIRLVKGWVDSDERKAEATMLKILNTALEVV
jgi:hypothetical protein